MEPAAHRTRGHKREASPPRPKDAGFTVVPRPDANHPVVLHLQQIDAYIRSAQGKRHIDKMLDGGVEGIRFIQKKRIEVFVQAEGKSSVAMDQILQAALPQDPHEPNDSDPERVRAMIVQYVEQQADSQRDYILGNFSLIVNLNKVEAQYPHVDLWHPNIQYGLALTDHCPATMVFATEPSITTARDFQTVACPDLPEALVALLDEKCNGLFQNFGNVLHPKPIRVQNEQSDTHGCSLRTGDVTILKGGRVHAGPAWDQPRVILFASGCPKTNKSDHDDNDDKSQAVEPYDPDVQYTRAQLMATILSAVFADLEQGHRVFLLTELAKMMKAASTKNLSLHLHDPVMIEFTSLVEKYESPRKKYPRGGKAAFIELFAREADLKLVSVLGLQTDHWKDQEEDEDGASAKMMEVYRSFDPNVAWVRYATTTPDEQQQDEQHQQPLEWTWDLDRLYTLQMTNSSTKRGGDGGGLNRPLFDGQKENGVLMDEQGTVMNCYLHAAPDEN